MKPKTVHRLRGRLASLEARAPAGDPLPDVLVPFAGVLVDPVATEAEKWLAALRLHAFSSPGGPSETLLCAIEQAEARIREPPDGGRCDRQATPLAVRDDVQVQGTLPPFMVELRRQRVARGWLAD